VVPILVERSRSLLEQYRARTPDSDKLVDIIIPVTFNFPSVGKLLTLLFIPFTAWMAGSALESYDYPKLFLVGLASYFAKAQTALPFLMDQFEIPQDLFQLYIPTSIVTGKFDTLVSAVNLLAFSLIGVAALSGSLVFNPTRILRYLVISVLALFLGVAATGSLLTLTIDTDLKKGEELLDMRLAEPPVAMRVHRSDPGTLRTSAQAGMPGIRHIKQRGRLRVGYVPSRYPYSFFNSAGELVGFDVEITNQLARDLGVELEFVPLTWGEMGNKLDARVIDLVPTVPYLPALLELVEYSDPVMTATAGFLVKDSRRHDFATLDALQAQRKLRAGIAADPEFVETQLRAWLPAVEFELVQLNSPDEFFAANKQDLDALITSAEIGTAFTLLHPEYALVVPEPTLWHLPLGFAAAKGNRELSKYLDGWVLGHQQRGTFQRAHKHWILGEGAKIKTPRWSVVRDILHWVD
jgi:ABC-type amino acid transport substrate-binding protein